MGCLLSLFYLITWILSKVNQPILFYLMDFSVSNFAMVLMRMILLSLGQLAVMFIFIIGSHMHF